MNNYSRENYSFLVTCVGAYDDSGIGTGGFVCVHQGNASVIDCMDSTGLFKTDKHIYRFVRSLKAVIGYNVDGIKFFVRLPETKDVHDIHVTEDEITCVSTGHNEIMWFDSFGKLLRTWHANGENDAWHLNCIEIVENNLYASAFGEFKSHREWNQSAKHTGFILNVNTGQKILEGLSGPHNPRYIDGSWFVCESHIHTLSIMDKNGTIQKTRLKGFTRGLTYDKDFIFVGESANRKAQLVPDFSYIVVLDRKSLEVVDRIKIPFREIYEIVIIQNEMASVFKNNSASFRFDFFNERITALESQVLDDYKKNMSVHSVKANLLPYVKICVKKFLLGKRRN